MNKSIIYILIILLFFAISCSKNEEQTETERTRDTTQLPSQVITKFNLTETVEGEKKWNLIARSASIYDKKELVIVDSVYITFYKNGAPYSTLIADSGQINQKTNDMEAIGDVVVTTVEGEKLETEKIEWDNSRNLIHSDKFVKVTRGNDILTGIGFETDPNLRHIQIKKDVKAYVKDGVEDL